MTNTEAPERTGALIQLTHVHLAYPGSQTEALADVSCSIPTGQHVCILGGNGSGKSTLLQLVNVLALPTSGASTRASPGGRSRSAAAPPACSSTPKIRW